MSEDRVRLEDGSDLMICEADEAAAELVAQAHPLPRGGRASETVYRAYYLAKSLLYVRAPEAGIACGMIDGELAGFIFYCRDLTRLRGFMLSPGTLLRLAGNALLGRFGYRPSFWWQALRWGWQHLRRPRAGGDEPASDLPVYTCRIGTTHIVDAFRRRGVASALMEQVQAMLAAQGASEVALWVAEDNEPARRLYEKRGYRAVGRQRRIDETCLLMVRDLKD